MMRSHVRVPEASAINLLERQFTIVLMLTTGATINQSMTLLSAYAYLN